MTATIRLDSWLDVLGREYFESFVRYGGTSIKFAVPMDENSRESIKDSIIKRGRDSGYVVAFISSAETRVHMIDQLFFRIAEQVPWRQLSEDVIRKLASGSAYELPAPGTEPLFRRIARANAIDPNMLLMEAKRWIARDVLGKQALAKDFRVAVTQLCLAELSGGPEGDTMIEVITDWLTGRNNAISAVKPYQIFSRVNRSNARHLLESLLLWVRFAGYPGLLILLDISRVTIAKNPRDDLIFYSKAAMFDSYEVLRQFIDATDRMQGCVMIVLPDKEFLDVEPSGRGLGAYDALKLRVYDEIRDEKLVNPMATLVRVSLERAS